MAQIILDSNNNLIQGDFDNATLNNRTKLQTTTTNATSNVYVVPNGSATSAGVSVANNSSLTNASKIVMATNGSTDTQIISGVNGSGTYLPLSFYTNNTLTAQLTTGGAWILPSNPSQMWFGDTSTGSFLQGTNTGGYLVFGTSGTEKMRITGTSLCINNTSSPGGQPLYVKATAGVGSAGLQVSANGSGAIDWYNASGTYVASVIVNSGSVAYNTTSDYRLKENIVPMTGALDKIAKLKPVTYTWKTTGEQAEGFIAHELAEVCPDAVSGKKDAVDAEGKPIYQGVDTSFLVATLTKAIQEQQEIINELKTRIEALESK